MSLYPKLLPVEFSQIILAGVAQRGASPTNGGYEGTQPLEMGLDAIICSR